jgi:DUF4097 and DUF4098 domain-containing protein YvlB
VRLSTFDGSITVRGWDRNEVYVEIEKRGRGKEEVQAIEVLAEQNGRQISIEARQPGPRKYAFGVVTTRTRDARIIASVPATSNVMLRTGEGALSIERIDGRLELRTTEGNVSGLDLRGELFVHTEDGHIRMEGLDGRCDVASGDGSITVNGRLDALRARTGDGSVVAKLLPGSRVGADWSLSSGEGALVLYLPEDLGAALDAETSRGIVRIDPALSLSAAGDTPRGIFKGTLAGGGHLLRLRTREGAINIKRLPGKVPLPPTDLER